jgi:hypothetical protein
MSVRSKLLAAAAAARSMPACDERPTLRAAVASEPLPFEFM